MASETIRTLLVEDNPGDARLISEALRESRGVQFELVEAARLTEATELLAAGPFDLVIPAD